MFAKLTVADQTAATMETARHGDYIVSNPDVFVLPDGPVWLNKRRWEDEEPRRRPDKTVTVTRPSRLKRLGRWKPRRDRNLMIDALKADRLADMIANGTGRGWTDDAVKLLADEIQTWENSGAAYVVAMDFVRTWTEEWRPTMGQIWARYNEEAAKATHAEAHLRAEERPQCDGTGWVKIRIGMVPCKRCNPYLRDLYDDPPLWERYLNGEKVSDLHSQVTVVDKKMVGTTGMPPTCKPDTVHTP